MKSLPLMTLSLSVLVACGGAQSTPGTLGGEGAGTDAAAATAGDIPLEIAPIEVQGMVFEPEALGRPGMPLVEPKRKTTIEKQRAVFASTKDVVQKQAHAAILATMLYQKSKDDKESEQALWGEARQVLRDAATAAGDKPDEITLRLLGSYELLLGDFAAAEKAWAGLVNADPKSKEAPYHRAWWAYSLLAQHKNADALAVVKDETLSEKQPELAYVTAWAKWRSGDDAGAWNAIVTAAKGWGNNAGKEHVKRDVYLFAGRANIALAEALPQVFAVFGANDKALQYEVLTTLGLQSYPFAGRWADAVAALDKAIEVAGATVPAKDRPRIRYQQAELVVRLDTPEVATKYAKQALEALPDCGAECPEPEKQGIYGGVYGMGRLFHLVYATANDDRYHDAAYALYTASVPKMTDEELRAQANKDLGALAATKNSSKPNTGTHDKGAIGALIGQRNQEAQACYEAGLVANPKLAGTIKVELEADQTGAIKGVSTEPKAGLADLSAVAGCIGERARTWKLPRRGTAGTTRIKLTYQLAARK